MKLTTFRMTFYRAGQIYGTALWRMRKLNQRKRFEDWFWISYLKTTYRDILATANQTERREFGKGVRSGLE